MSTAPWTVRALYGGPPVEDARLAGATALWEWIGDGATVFSY